jgi:hypothetical protein
MAETGDSKRSDLNLPSAGVGVGLWAMEAWWISALVGGRALDSYFEGFVLRFYG